MDRKASARRQSAAKSKQLRRAMALPLASDQADDIVLGYYLTLESLRAGTGNRYHIGSLAQATYMAMFLSQANHGAARPELFRETEAAILRCREAGLGTGVWRLEDSACALLAEVLRLFDQQLKIAPVSALKAANERLKKLFGRAENVAADAPHASGSSERTGGAATPFASDIDIPPENPDS